MLSEMIYFMAIIFTLPGVAVTPAIDMVDKKVEVVLFLHMLLTSQ